MKKILLLPAFLMIATLGHSQVKYVGNVPAPEPGEVTVSNNGKFVYLATSNEIHTYEMNTATGGLTKKLEVQRATNTDFTSLYLSPDDKYLYAQLWIQKSTGTSSMLLIYACNQQTGALTLQSTLDQQDGVSFDMISGHKLSPDGNLLFLATRSRQDLYVYRRDAGTGALSFLSKTTGETLQQFYDYAFSPDSRFIYVNSPNTYKHALVYSIDPNSGTLSKIQDAGDPLKKDDNGEDLVVSPDGKHVYTIHKRNVYIQGDADYINQYNRDERSGMLTYQNNYTGLGIKDIDRLYVDGSGNFVYVVSSFGSELHGVHVLKRDPSSGNLVKQQSFEDKAPTDKLRGSFEMRFSSNNRFIYVPAARDNVLNIFENPNASGSQARPVISSSVSNQSNVIANTNVSSNTNIPVNNNSDNNRSTSTKTLSPVSKEQFNEIMKKLQAEQSDTRKLDMCYELLEGKAFKTTQAYSVGMLFSSEYKRLEFVKFASYFVSDRENFGNLADLFTYESILQDFNKIQR